MYMVGRSRPSWRNWTEAIRRGQVNVDRRRLRMVQRRTGYTDQGIDMELGESIVNIEAKSSLQTCSIEADLRGRGEHVLIIGTDLSL
jgi:hypothetical protein